MKRAPIVVAALSGLALAIAAVACGGGGGGGGSRPTIKSFSASPASLPPGGGTVTLTWSVTGATALEVEPLVGMVAGTSATVTVGAQTTFTLSALNPHGVSTKQTVVTTAAGSPITVSGRIVHLGPLKGAIVAIVNQGLSPVVTATDGTFTIANVVAPYTIVAWDTQSSASVFVGATRTDPTLQLDGTPNGSSQQTLSGALSGSGLPYGASATAMVSLYSPEGVRYSVGTQPNGAWDGSYQVTWTGSSTTTATLHGLEYSTDINGLPATYGGFGSATVVLPGGASSVTNANATLAAVTTDTFTGTYTLPPNVSYSSVTPYIELSNDHVSDVIPLPPAPITGGTITLKTPAISGATIGAAIIAYGANGASSTVVVHGYAPNATGVAIAVPPSAMALFPPSGGSADANTTFTYQAPAGSIVRQVFQDGSLKLMVHAPATGAFKMPDLSEVGMNFAPGVAYSWTVQSYGPFNTIDDALGPLGLQGSGDTNVTTAGQQRTFYFQ